MKDLLLILAGLGAIAVAFLVVYLTFIQGSTNGHSIGQ
jgi:hypothetical protein